MRHAWLCIPALPSILTLLLSVRLPSDASPPDASQPGVASGGHASPGATALPAARAHKSPRLDNTPSPRAAAAAAAAAALAARYDGAGAVAAFTPPCSPPTDDSGGDGDDEEQLSQPLGTQPLGARPPRVVTPQSARRASDAERAHAPSPAHASPPDSGGPSGGGGGGGGGAAARISPRFRGLPDRTPSVEQWDVDGEDVDPAPPALRGGRAARAVSAGGDAALDDEGAPPEDVHGGAEYGCEGEVRGGGGAAWGTARAQPEARGAPRGGPGRAKPPKPADRAAARKTPKKAVVEDDDDEDEEEEEEAWVVPAAAAPKRGAAAPPLLPARATRGSGAPLVVPPPDNQWVAKYKGREVPPLLAFETNTARGAAHAATAAAAAAKPAARRAARGAAAGAEAAAAAAEQHAAFVGAGLDGILQQAGRSTRLAGGRMPPPQRAQAPQPPPKPAKKQPPKPRAPRLERVPFAGGVLEVGQLVYVTCDSGGGDGDDSMAGAGEGDGGGGRSPSDRFLAGTLRLARVEELLLATAAAGEAGGGGGGNGNGGGGGYAPASPAFSALLRWVYRPEDTQPGRQAHHPRRFVYLADGPTRSTPLRRTACCPPRRRACCRRWSSTVWRVATRSCSHTSTTR